MGAPPNSRDNPKYMDALKEMDDAYRAFLTGRQKASESANGLDHYTSGMDESLFNHFLEKKNKAELLAKQKFSRE